MPWHVAQKRIHLTKAQTEKFYDVHAVRPFYNDLYTFMFRPCGIQVLEDPK